MASDKPLPPDVLASALQDRIAPSSGKLLKSPSPVRASAQATSQTARTLALQLWLECVSAADPFNQEKAALTIDAVLARGRQQAEQARDGPHRSAGMSDVMLD